MPKIAPFVTVAILTNGCMRADSAHSSGTAALAGCYSMVTDGSFTTLPDDEFPRDPPLHVELSDSLGIAPFVPEDARVVHQAPDPIADHRVGACWQGSYTASVFVTWIDGFTWIGSGVTPHGASPIGALHAHTDTQTAPLHTGRAAAVRRPSGTAMGL